MPQSPFDPCIPTKAAKVPDRPEWLHEIKHDGYRLIVQRDGKSVRLWTKGGHDWSHRYPLITEAALRNRNTSFVIDGEAVRRDCRSCLRVSWGMGCNEPQHGISVFAHSHAAFAVSDTFRRTVSSASII